jgi:hypothetical protein
MADTDLEQADSGYQPPCAEDLEVAGGTVEAASMVVTVPISDHTY